MKPFIKFIKHFQILFRYKLLILFSFCSSFSLSQEYFICVESSIYSKDSQSCEIFPVCEDIVVQTGGGTMSSTASDIAYLPNGKLYLLMSNYLIEIDPSTCSSTTLSNQMAGMNSLEGDGANTLYITGDSEVLSTYSVLTQTLTNLGNLPCLPAGDLAFVGADLFVTCLNGDLIKINITNPAASTVIGNLDSDGFYALSTMYVDCTPVALLGYDDDGMVYEIDPSDATKTLFCDMSPYLPVTVSPMPDIFPDYLNPANGATVIPPICDCTPPTLEINDIVSCEEEFNLEEAIGENSDIAIITYHNSQNDAENNVNPINNIVTTSGTYWIRAEDSADEECYNTYSVTVDFSSFDFTINTVSPTCGSNDGEIQITISNGIEPFTYSIDNGVTSQGNGLFTNLGVGTYEVIIEDGGGCEASETVQLTQPNAPEITSVDVIESSCTEDDGAITINLSGGTGEYEYSIDNGNNFQSENTFNGLGAGEYIIVVKDENGCEAITTVVVNALNAPTITLEEKNNISCYGESDGSIVVSVTGGTAGYSYQWSPEVSTTNSADGLSAGAYTVTVVDTEGCEDALTVNITEPNNLEIVATITPATCGNNDGSISLQVSGGTGNYTYNWEGNVSTGANASQLSAGVYTVTVTDENGCSATYTGEVEVSLSTNIFGISIIPENAVITVGEEVEIELQIDPNVDVNSISWSPPDGLSCTNCENPIATPNQTTTYVVTVVDENGCAATDSILIIVEEPCTDLFIPNTFSPNGDGKNDFQCVFGSCIAEMNFMIFNRWGEKIFETQNKKECWDGTFRGEYVQTGVYTYVLIGRTTKGETIKESGNLTLIR